MLRKQYKRAESIINEKCVQLVIDELFFFDFLAQFLTHNQTNTNSHPRLLFLKIVTLAQAFFGDKTFLKI